MVTAITAIPAFVSLKDYARQQVQRPARAPRVMKVELPKLQASSEVCISNAARQLLAAEQMPRLTYDWEL
jgi:hypothetical protein